MGNLAEILNSLTNIEYIKYYKKLREHIIREKNRLEVMKVDLQFAIEKDVAVELEKSIFKQRTYVERLTEILTCYGRDIINFSNTFREPKKEIFVLLYISNYTVKEVAEKTKYAVSTIRTIKCDIDKIVNNITIEEEN